MCKVLDLFFCKEFRGISKPQRSGSRQLLRSFFDLEGFNFSRNEGNGIAATATWVLLLVYVLLRCDRSVSVATAARNYLFHLEDLPGFCKPQRSGCANLLVLFLTSKVLIFHARRATGLQRPQRGFYF